MVEAAKPHDMFDALMIPISLGLAEKCDAVLRIGGPSKGADEEVAFIRSKGRKVYYSLDEIEVSQQPLLKPLYLTFNTKL